MSVPVEKVVGDALREWLLLKLPAKCAQVNAQRAAVLKAAIAGPFLIGAGATLGLSIIANDATFRTVNLTPGAAQTSAQVAADINATAGLAGTAAVDSADRWYVTSPTIPSASGDSKVEARGSQTGTTTDINPTFGLDRGGLKELRSAILAPPTSSLFNGWPVTPVFAPRSPAGAYLACVIGDKKAKPMPGGPRRHGHLVTLDLTVLRMALGEAHYAERPIESCVRCVREVLLQDSGRRLGRELYGDVQLVEEVDTTVRGAPFAFTPGAPLYDAAVFQLAIQTYAVPEAT